MCHGTGQVSFFKGESRFLLSVEECPECLGMGFILTAGTADDAAPREREDREGELPARSRPRK